jgi:hypothetical protein
MKLVNPIAVLVAVAWVAWSGLRPGHGDSRKWYDRLIRAVGGLIVLAALTFGLILVLSGRPPR